MGNGGQYIPLSDLDKDSNQNVSQPHIHGTLILQLHPTDTACRMDPLGPIYPTRFEPNKQTWSLFKDQVSRLTFTVLLDTLYVASLKIYQDAGTVRHSHKHTFNVVTTGLSLALGLNFLVGLFAALITRDDKI